MRIRMFLAVLVALAIPATAPAATMKFCLLYDAIYRDSGIADEDYWTAAWGGTPDSRYIRGSEAFVYENGTYRYGGTLGDGIGVGDNGLGCTANFYAQTANNHYTIYVTSAGTVNGWTVNVRNRSTRAVASAAFPYDHTRGAGTFDVTLTAAIGNITNGSSENDTWDLLNSYQAAAYTFYRHGGGMGSAQTIDIMVGRYAGANETDCNGGQCWCSTSCTPANCNCGACYSSQSDKVWIENCYQDRKFQVSHELGHALYSRYTNNARVANNCSFVDTSNDFNTASDYCPDGSGKIWTSIEYAGCGQFEGFAEFYAADIFNNHDETDCQIYTHTAINGSFRRVNCEQGTPDPDPATGVLIPTRYMENHCVIEDANQNAAMQGRGTQADWVRTYWNVHTDGSRVDFWTMLDWIDAADSQPWDKEYVYDILNASAADNFFNTTLYDNWQTVKGSQGIDHAGP